MWEIYCWGDKNEDAPFRSNKTYEVYEDGQMCTWLKDKWHKSYNISERMTSFPLPNKHFLWIISKLGLIKGWMWLNQFKHVSGTFVLDCILDWIPDTGIGTCCMHRRMNCCMEFLILPILISALDRSESGRADRYPWASVWAEILFEN